MKVLTALAQLSRKNPKKNTLEKNCLPGRGYNGYNTLSLQFHAAVDLLMRALTMPESISFCGLKHWSSPNLGWEAVGTKKELQLPPTCLQQVIHHNSLPNASGLQQSQAKITRQKPSRSSACRSCLFSSILSIFPSNDPHLRHTTLFPALHLSPSLKARPSFQAFDAGCPGH